MDETRIIESIKDNGLVVGSVNKRFIQKKKQLGSKVSVAALGRSRGCW
jgi:hypothetical protein